MKKLMMKLLAWFGDSQPKKWWDEEPVRVIRGTDLLDVLNHRMAS